MNRLAKKLPWWLALALALLSLGVLHKLAAVTGHVVLAIGQYLIPLLLLALAGVSASQRRKQRRLQREVGELSGAAVIDGMGWPEFELLVREGFRRRGYAVADTGTPSSSRSADLWISRGRERFLVQCQQWRASTIEVGMVRDLHTAVSAQGAAGGFIVTSGFFTPEATRFAEGRSIRLIDGMRLRDLIRSSEEKTIPLIRRRTEAPAVDSVVSRH